MPADIKFRIPKQDRSACVDQFGKFQITKLLAQARLQQGEKFKLRVFHDFVRKNGNVPIALRRWEYLGRFD